MEVIFKPKHNKEEIKCKQCDHGRCNLPLIENEIYKVVNIKDEMYQLMGWGSMLFNPECFIDVVLE